MTPTDAAQILSSGSAQAVIAVCLIMLWLEYRRQAADCKDQLAKLNAELQKNRERIGKLEERAARRTQLLPDHNNHIPTNTPRWLHDTMDEADREDREHGSEA